MKEQISKIVAEVVETQEWKTIFDLIEIPPDYKMGDFAIPCFSFAKIMHKNPSIIANEVKEALDSIAEMSAIEMLANAHFIKCTAEQALAHLGNVERILGDNRKLKQRIKNLERNNGRCVVLPCEIGNTVYHITTCKGFPSVLDGTLYDSDGGHGTATGYYCPCELDNNCPFPLDDDDGSFDCAKHKNALAIFEDVVIGFVINDAQELAELEYSGAVYFDAFGKTVFLTREAAEAAMKGGAL